MSEQEYVIRITNLTTGVSEMLPYIYDRIGDASRYAQTSLIEIGWEIMELRELD